MKKFPFTIVLMMYIMKSVSGQGLFNKYYSVSGLSPINLLQTSDSGYIITNSPAIGGSYDFSLIKLNALGDTLWTRSYGGPDEENFEAIDQTADGGYILAGFTSSFSNAFHIYLIRTNSLGDTLWTKLLMAPQNGTAESIQQTTDGGFIITGGVLTSVFLEVGLIKTDSMGNIQWSKSYGNNYSQQGNCVLQTSDGGYIVTGTIDGFGAGNSDALLIKTDVNGNIMWDYTYGGLDNDIIYAICKNYNGYILAGFTKSFGAGPYDVYLIRTDLNGTILWSKTYGGPGSEEAWSVERTTDGGFIAAGYTYSFGGGNTDAYLLKINQNGDTLWTKTYGDNGSQDAYSFLQTSDSGLAFSGISSIPFQSVRLYVVKTDTSFSNVCNMNSTATIVSAAPTQTTPLVEVTSTPVLTTTSTPTIIGRGGAINDLCSYLNIPVNIQNFHFEISPNPVNNILTINSISYPIKKIEIINMLGKNVETIISNHSTNLSINVTGLDPDIYILKAETEIGIQSEIFIKQ